MSVNVRFTLLIGWCSEGRKIYVFAQKSRTESTTCQFVSQFIPQLVDYTPEPQLVQLCLLKITSLRSWTEIAIMFL